MTKPARRIEELTAQVASLQKLLAAATAKAAAMVDEALATARSDHDAATEADRERIIELGVSYRAIERDRNEKAARVGELQHQIIKLIEERKQDAIVIAAREARFAINTAVDADLGRRIAELGGVRKELDEMVGAVRDRMRRREQEAARALLNRAAVAAAVPGLRRP